jgi:L-ascorbate metabolism protein UlaG (beta-lactamase superfamily)
MRFQLLRHATCVLEYHGRQILLDPVFADKGALPPITASPRKRPNPIVALPVSQQEVSSFARGCDFLLVTHTHMDHLDPSAIDLLRKETPLVCQPEDVDKLSGYGFSNLHPVALNAPVNVQDISIRRCVGHHGKGMVGDKMGHVSGFLLSASGEPTVFVTGDTIWCEEVEEFLRRYTPDVVILYAGAAQFLVGGRITMSICDARKIASALPVAQMIAVHMEAYNHCLLSRAELRRSSEKHGFSNRLRIPADGESFVIGGT